MRNNNNVNKQNIVGKISCILSGFKKLSTNLNVILKEQCEYGILA